MENEKCFCHFNGYKVKDAEARSRIETIEGEIADNSNNVKEVLDNIILINERVNTIEGTYSNLEGTDATLTAGISTNAEEINKVKEDVTSLTETINSIDTRITELHSTSSVFGRIFGKQIYTNNSGAVIIPWSGITQTGTGITMDDTGKITIGAGVKKVEVSFLIEGQAGNNSIDYIEYGLRKNGEVKYKGYHQEDLVAYNKTSFGLPSFEVVVEEGDYLHVIAYCSKEFIINSNYSGMSYIRVREIKD